MLSIKAASSINSNDTASERAASALDDFAVILDPFLSLRDNLHELSRQSRFDLKLNIQCRL